MRNMLILVVAWLFALNCGAQHVTESVLSLKRKFSPLIGSTSSVMTMTLQKDYDIGGKDSVLSFVVVVSETEREVQGMSIGFSSFSLGGLLGGGSSAGVNMAYEKRNGVVRMDREVFMVFYKCVNDVYRLTGTMANVGKDKPNALCTCGAGGIQFGGEYLPDGFNTQKFYFKLDDAVFSMSKAEFEEIVKFVREVKLVLDARA